MKNNPWIPIAAIAGVGAFALIVMIVAPPAPTPRTASAPIAQAAVYPDDELLVRMGRIAARDNYHLGLRLDRDGVEWRESARDFERRNPRPAVDPSLTAEKVFAAKYSGPSGIIHFFIGPSSDGINAQSMSKIEFLRLQGLRRIHTMAALTLYNDHCRQEVSAIRLIKEQFQQLPPPVQQDALARETSAIWKQLADGSPGGWPWFCRRMGKEISEGHNDPVFQTAIEQRNGMVF